MSSMQDQSSELMQAAASDRLRRDHVLERLKTIQSKHRNSRGYDAEKLRQQKSESREVTAVVVAESSTRRAFAISEISEHSEEVQRKIQRQQARLASLKGISAPPSQPHQPHQPCQPYQQVSSEEEKESQP